MSGIIGGRNRGENERYLRISFKGLLDMWEQKYIETPRGRFELFTCGKGEPLCVTHLYSEFNERGYYFADAFAGNFKVYLVNLKEAGHSCKVNHNAELSMSEAANDLEAIREAVGLKQWAFAGHSTGGMLGLVYAILFPGSLSKLMTGGQQPEEDIWSMEEACIVQAVR